MIVRQRRPGIDHVGTITDDGTTVMVSGWGLSLCASRCVCHRQMITQTLVLLEDKPRGLLGLVSFRAGCNCCQPWKHAELRAFLRDLAHIESLATSEEQPS